MWPNNWPSFSGPLENPSLIILSLGAGVQSSTLLLSADRGDLGPKPDFAVFSDTGDEPREVYRWLWWLQTQVSIPIVIARRAGPTLKQATLEVSRGERPLKGTSIPPLWLDEPYGMVPKQCSRTYKTRVVTAWVRDRLGIAPGERAPKHIKVEMWIGMSMDELTRVKRHEAPWITNRFPLIEAGLTRNGCIALLESLQIPKPPKSSCIFCPFRRKQAWKEMRDNAPWDWQEATAFDRAIRNIPGLDGVAYVSDDRVPLEELDLDGAEDETLDMFNDQCEGVCGV